MNVSPATAWSEEFRKMGVEMASSRRLLLVDDEPDNLDVLATLLEDEFDVHVASNGRQALDVAAKINDFAVVITDQRMPGMTGVELLTEFSRRWPDTLRMVLTAYSDLPPIVAAVNEGSVYRLFLKPWDPTEMRAAVADAVWLYEAQTALGRLVELLAVRRADLAATLERLKRSQNELLASERMSTLGRFSAGITHNIRNSLTVMMHLVDTVQQQPTEPGLVRAAQHAFETLDALLRVANDVNALARGRLDSVLRVRAELPAFLERVVTSFGNERLGRACPVRIDHTGLGGVFSFDQGRVGQAILALLRSAAQASPPGTPLVVSVDTQGPAHRGSRDLCFEIRVDDASPRGPAPAAEEQKAPESAELALGLEVARVVAEAHGGRLVVVPQPGRVSAFELWLASAAEVG